MVSVSAHDKRSEQALARPTDRRLDANHPTVLDQDLSNVSTLADGGAYLGRALKQQVVEAVTGKTNGRATWMPLSKVGEVAPAPGGKGTHRLHPVGTGSQNRSLHP